ncbi:hypothetical protein [Kitasatospora sp. NPDC094015]|uniref:hypothetical protein n=1 Tax=Kitasatospora sp. NPDC094015 TaxID=3155205 RepID=UPI00331ED0AF
MGPLPPGSRDTLLTIGSRMPEGRMAVSRARSQLIEEGFVHSRRTQHPTKGTWSTRVLVSSVPLTEREQVEAAWDSAVHNPALGEPPTRAVGTSPQGEKTEQNTSLPAEASAPPGADLALAAGLLDRLTARDTRLRLGASETLELAPLVCAWLARDPDPGRLRDALLSGLPGQVFSTVGLLRRRLERKMPAPEPAPVQRRYGECAHCADPVPLPGESCGSCSGRAGPTLLDGAAIERNRRGVELARSLLRGGVA